MLKIFLFTLVLASSANSAIQCQDSPSPLFTKKAPNDYLEMNIYADHLRLNDDSSSVKFTPAILLVNDKGNKFTVGAELARRGNSRQRCKLKPYKLIFENEKLIYDLNQQSNQNPFILLHKLTETRIANPLLEGVPQKQNLFWKLGDDIKIVNTCDYDSGWLGSTDPVERRSLLLKEFYVYKIFEELKTSTLKVRLAKINYINPDGSLYLSDFAFFREPENKAGERCGLSKGAGAQSDKTSLFNLHLQFGFIGGVDYYSDGHNVYQGHDSSNNTHFIGYDYDLTTFVLPANRSYQGSESIEFMRDNLKQTLGVQNQSSQNEVKKFLHAKNRMIRVIQNSYLDHNEKRRMLVKMDMQFKILEGYLR